MSTPPLPPALVGAVSTVPGASETAPAEPAAAASATRAAFEDLDAGWSVEGATEEPAAAAPAPLGVAESAAKEAVAPTVTGALVEPPTAPAPMAAQAPVPSPVSSPVPVTNAAADAAVFGERVRAFLAVNLPIALLRRIGDEVATLRTSVQEAGARVSWVPAANLHVTLKFLGPIRPELVEGIRGALARGLETRSGFELEMRGFGGFPSSAAPRVLWAGVAEQPQLSALVREIETWMEALGLPREERPYQPHLTIGRYAGGSREADTAVTLGLESRAAMVLGAGRVSEVVLYESRVVGKGAEYHALCRVPFGPRR
jgi:2'-5' RNA ligase